MATFIESLSGGVNPLRNALEFDTSTGTLYSISGSGAGFFGGDRSSFLATIDIGAGTYTEIGDMGVLNMAALAIDNGAAAVPEPISLVSLTIGLTAVGGFATWRRRRSAK